MPFSAFWLLFVFVLGGGTNKTTEIIKTKSKQFDSTDPNGDKPKLWQVRQ